MKKRILYSCLFLLLISIPIYAQLSPQLDWFKSYDGIGNGNDFVNDIKFDNNFNCYLAGRSAGTDGSQDFLILKYSKYGELITEIRYVSAPASWEEANSIFIDTDQNIYAIGNATFGLSTFFAVIHKYSPNGDLVWEKNYLNSLDIGSEGVKITLDYENNVIAGINSSGANIIKFSPTGDSLWSVNINDDTSSYSINNLITDVNSNVYVTYSRSYYNGGDIAETEIILSKISKIGQIEWSNILDVESPRKLLFDRDYNLVVASHSDAKLIKYSLSGDLVWDYNSNGLLTDISIDNNNDIIMCGYNSGIGVFDYMIKKISKEGTEIWNKTYNSIEDLRDFASSTVIDNENNIYVTGNASDMFTQGISYTLKYDTNGNLKWQFRYDIPHSKFEHPQNIFLDDSNNVIIAGDYTDSTNGSNFFVLKIKQKLGTIINQSDNNLPLQYSLSQNYPNPFNPITNIEFRTSNFGFVSLKVYDVLGNKIRTLVNEEKPAGEYQVTFDGSNLTSGIYIYRLTINEKIISKKMILLK